MPAGRSDLPNTRKAAVGAVECAGRGNGSECLRSTEGSTFAFQAHRLSGTSDIVESCPNYRTHRAGPRRGCALGSAAMACAAASVRVAGLSQRCRLRGRARPRNRAPRRWTRASIEVDGEPSVTIDDDTSEGAPDSAEATSSAEDSAGVFVTSGRFNASPRALWRALTEYESLQNASGAIGRCRRLWISSRVGRACLRLQSRDAAYLWGSMRADATVEIQEDLTRGEIRYKVVAGSSAPDIGDAATESVSSKPFANEFDVSGTWRLRPVKGASYLCDVELETRIAPRRYPVSVAALRKWTELQLADTVKGAVKRAIEIDQIRLRAPRFLPALETSFGNSGPADRGGVGGEGAAAAGGPAKEQPLAPSGYLGLSDVPLAAVLGEEAGNGAETSPSGEASSASAEKRDADSASSRRGVADRWFADGDANLIEPGSSEVHMRRFDSDSAFHRRAIGAVRVEAPPSAVYAILTDYESYPDFIPDLAFLELVRAPRTNRVARAAGHARARAMAAFARTALYHCLEDAVTFDLTRRDDLLEVRFRVVDAFAGAAEAPGDRITQGKWLVLPCPNAPDATILKFAVEGRAPRRTATRAKGFWRNYASSRYWDASPDDGAPLSERAVFDGVLRMLLFTREHSERVFAAASESGGAKGLENEEEDKREEFFAAARLAPSAPVLSRLSGDDPMKRIEAQLRELGYGGDRPSMPRRIELRARGAQALEREIVNAGGFAAVAAKLGWTKNLRKPRGYWNEIANVEREVRLCIAERGLESGVMPSRPQLEELGRFDIARALEKHGGAAGIARKIGLKEPRYRARKAKAKR